WYTVPDTTGRPLLDAEWSNFLPFNQVTANTVILDDPSGMSGVQTARLSSTELVDLWFGMTVDFEFFMPQGGMMGVGDASKPMVFDFHGDDDVFVYINGVLVLDIGGTHAAQDGWIDFSTGKVLDPTCVTTTTQKVAAADAPAPSDVTSADGMTRTVVTVSEADGNGQVTVTTEVAKYKTLRGIFEAAKGDDFNPAHFNGDTFANYTEHTLKFFYMERGGNISFSRLKYNMPILVGELNVAKQVNDQLAAAAGNESFDYVLSECQEDGTKLDGVDGVPYIIVTPNGEVIMEDEQGNTLETKDGGKFSLKANEVASFLFDTSENDTAWISKLYCVEEEQDADGSTVASRCFTVPIEADENHHDGYVSENPYVTVPLNLEPDETVDVEFKNVYVEDLAISKTVDEDANEEDAAKIWGFEVKLSSPDLADFTIAEKDDSGAATGGKCIVLDYEKLGADGVVSETGELMFDLQSNESGMVGDVYVGAVYLQADETLVLKGLPVGTNYKVSELDAPEDDAAIEAAGYKVTAEGAEGAIALADADAYGATASFVNDFAASNELCFGGIKKLLVDGEEAKLSDYTFDFEFVLKGVAGAPMPEGAKTVDNEATCTVSLDKETGAFEFDGMVIEYGHMGNSYVYTLEEVKGNVPGVTYDDAKYVISLMVGYDAESHSATLTDAVLELETGADQLEEAEEIVFTNEYEKPAPVPGDKLDPTGDTTPVALIAVLAAVALLALLVVLVVMRRRNRA
ncbi:MAG: hypothetical protein IJC51_00435, partial [Eggerthellaceae bacterium]|nr:hypothetical protein [Eggerthellaceae bacterium]